MLAELSSQMAGKEQDGAGDQRQGQDQEQAVGVEDRQVLGGDLADDDVERLVEMPRAMRVTSRTCPPGTSAWKPKRFGQGFEQGAQGGLGDVAQA